MDWSVYILECSDKSLYCGITNDIKKRVSKHESGLGARYTRGRGPFRLLYVECFSNHKEAAQREIEIKGWSREKKINLIKLKNKECHNLM